VNWILEHLAEEGYLERGKEYPLLFKKLWRGTACQTGTGRFLLIRVGPVDNQFFGF
jgi:hypothetical protein